MVKTIFLNQPWPYLFTLQILLAMTLLTINQGTVCASDSDSNSDSDSDSEYDYMMGGPTTRKVGTRPPLSKAEKLWQLDQKWGKKETNFMDFLENEKLVPVAAYFVNPEEMERLENYDNGEAGSDILNQKRGWKKMNVAWGKRRNAGPFMNREFLPSAAASSLGKREPNWNNLKGMWGKRSANPVPEAN